MRTKLQAQRLGERNIKSIWVFVVFWRISVCAAASSSAYAFEDVVAQIGRNCAAELFTSQNRPMNECSQSHRKSAKLLECVTFRIALE